MRKEKLFCNKKNDFFFFRKIENELFYLLYFKQQKIHTYF